MLRLAVNELTTYRCSLEEDLQNYASAGIEGIGVWRQKLTDCGEQAGIDLICESGLSVSSLQWAGGFTGSDGRTHRDGIEDGIEALELAACLRADCLIAYTGGRGGHTRGHARRLTVTAFKELAANAADLDVVLAVEPMHAGCGLDWTFLNNIDEALRFMDQVDSPNLKLVFDTYHFGGEPNILRRLPKIADRLALVQLGDSVCEPCGEQDRRPLGSGSLPITEIVHCIQESGYDGFYEVELLGQEIEFLDCQELLVQSVNTIHDMIRIMS